MEKIVHVSFSDSKGGAAIAAYRLHEAMIENGLDSEMIVYERCRKDDRVHHIYREGILSYVYKLSFLIIGDNSFKSVKNYGHYSFFSQSNFFIDKKMIMDADIIYLHWINRGLLGYRNIKKILKSGKKVIWVMHDMFPITGGCHHSFECEKYTNGCEECPLFGTLHNYAKKQISNKIELAKYKNLYWVAPSKWLYNCATKSVAVDNNRLLCIPNVINGNFFPLNKEFAKKALKLNLENKYILYGADNVHRNPYKGFKHFVDVISKVKKYGIDNVELLLFGEADEKYIMEEMELPINFLGIINDERTMNLVYNAADLFVMTSIAENYPLTIQECIACETRVIAFDVGGISDLIDDETKGVLIPGFNTSDMASSMIRMLSAESFYDSTLKDIDIERKKTINAHLSIIGNGY